MTMSEALEKSANGTARRYNESGDCIVATAAGVLIRSVPETDQWEILDPGDPDLDADDWEPAPIDEASGFKQ